MEDGQILGPEHEEALAQTLHERVAFLHDVAEDLGKQRLGG